MNSELEAAKVEIYLLLVIGYQLSVIRGGELVIRYWLLVIRGGKETICTYVWHSFLCGQTYVQMVSLPPLITDNR